MHPRTTTNYINKKFTYCRPHSKTILFTVESKIYRTSLQIKLSQECLGMSRPGSSRIRESLIETDADTRSWKIWYGTQQMTTPRTKNRITIFRCRSVHRSDSDILFWPFPLPAYCESRDSRENRRLSVIDRLVGVLHGDAGTESVRPLEPFLIGPLPFTLYTGGTAWPFFRITEWPPVWRVPSPLKLLLTFFPWFSDWRLALWLAITPRNLIGREHQFKTTP